jgi:lipopolysaccharide export system permease protein
MGILSRYLLRQFLAASGLVFLGLFVTWTTAEGVLHLDRFQESFSGALKLVLFRTLEVVPLGLPLACLTGAAWSLTRSARYRELTAIRSGGVPLRRVLAPILVSAVVLAAGLTLFEDRILVPVRSAIGEQEQDSRGGSGVRALHAHGRWWFAQGSSLFSARAYDPKTLRLRAISLFEFDPQRRMTRRVDAEEAQFLRDKSWEFRNARILVFEDSGTPKIRQEQRITLALQVSESELSRALPEPGTTSLHMLARGLREGDISSERAGLATAFHSRLAQPAAVLILVLFAVGTSIGEADRQDTLGRSLLRALLAALAYWTAWTAAILLAGSGQVPAAFPIWAVTALFLGWGGLQYRAIRE